MSISRKLRETVTEEFERRIEEAESYLEFSQSETADIEQQFAEAIRDALGKQGIQADPDNVAMAAANTACEVLCARLSGLKRRPVERAIGKAVQQVVTQKLADAQRYLELLTAYRVAQTHESSWALTELFRERLDECEDWITLDIVDWDRIRAIILPERSQQAWRKYSAHTLSLWAKFCRTVLPESYADPDEKPVPTETKPGTWEKIAVLEKRFADGEQLHAANDAVVYEFEALLAPQSGGNGRKDARTIGGVDVDKQLVGLQGLGRQILGLDQVEEDEDWWRLRPPTKDSEVSSESDRDAEAVDESPAGGVPFSPGGTQCEVMVDSDPPKKAKRAKKKTFVDGGGWLPFGG